MDVWVVASHVGVWAISLVNLFAVLVLARQIGILHGRLPPFGARGNPQGPSIGQSLDLVTGSTVDGIEVPIVAESGQKQLLVFVSPTCSACADLMPAVRSISRSDDGQLTATVVSMDGDVEDNRPFVRKNHLENVRFVVAPSARASYGIPATPFAVVLDDDGLVLSKGLTNRMEHLESLLEWNTALQAQATESGGSHGHSN